MTLPYDADKDSLSFTRPTFAWSGSPARFGLPLDFSGSFAPVRYRVSHVPDGDGIEHYPEYISKRSSQATSCRTLPLYTLRYGRGLLPVPHTNLETPKSVLMH